MDIWRFTIQVSSSLVATIRNYISTQQRVEVRAQGSLAEFHHRVRQKFKIPTQVDVQLFWRDRGGKEIEVTESNYETLLRHVRHASQSPTLQLMFSVDKFEFIWVLFFDELLTGLLQFDLTRELSIFAHLKEKSPNLSTSWKRLRPHPRREVPKVLPKRFGCSNGNYF
jgi:hypothetical protein